MQFKEERPMEYVDISRVPDEEMRPHRFVPPGCGRGPRRAEPCLRRRPRCDPGAGRARRIESACLRARARPHPRKLGPAPRCGAQDVPFAPREPDVLHIPLAVPNAYK